MAMVTPQQPAPVPPRHLLPLAALFFVLTFRFAGEPVATGLDPSYRFALNQLFAGEVGERLLFSHGPLGFVLFPQPVGHNLLLGNLLAALVHLAFSFFWVRLALARCSTPGRIALSSLLALLLGNVVTHLGIAYELVALGLIGTLSADDDRRWLALPVACSALALLIKPAFGVLCACYMVGHLAFHALLSRRARELLWGVAALPPAVLVGWLAATGGLDGLGDFLRASWELALGNVSAMAINPGLHHWATPALILAPLLLLLPARPLPWHALLALVVPLLVWAKYAFTRPDHVVHLLQLVVLVLVVALLRPGRLRARAALLGSSVAALLVVGWAIGAPRHAARLPVTDLLGSSLRWSAGRGLLQLATVGRQHRELDALSRQRTRRARLPASLRHRIGQATVDTYPWETSYVFANHLVWRPRPVFQSYISYTPWLDGQNAAFFASARAPTFLLWDLGMDRPRGAVESIDRRYLPSDEPLTMMEIVRRYRFVAGEDRSVALLRRTSQPAFAAPRSLGQVRARWARWLEVPRATGIVRARVELEPSPRGTLTRLLFVEPEVFVVYTFADGRTRIHRVVVDNARSGLWVSPYLEAHRFPPRDWTDGRPVRAIKLLARSPRAFRDSFVLEWELLPIVH